MLMVMSSREIEVEICVDHMQETCKMYHTCVSYRSEVPKLLYKVGLIKSLAF
jgi:hypothetical protein